MSSGNFIKLQEEQQHERRASQKHTHPHSHPHIHQASASYNPLKMPADWKFAENHARARRTAKEIERKDGKMQEVCPCCGYELEREDLNMCTQTQELAFLGAGYPLFYNYIKYSILLLVTLALFESIPNLYIYGEGNFCDKTSLESATIIKNNDRNPDPNFQTPCNDFYLLTYSMANVINKSFPDWQIYLQIAVQVLVMIILMVFRYHQRKIDTDVDAEMVTPADFSVIVKNIPHGFTGNQIVKELKEKIENHACYPRKVQVVSVVPVYKIDELEHKEEEIKKEIKHKQLALQKENVNFDYNHHEIKEIDEKIEHLEEEVEQINNKIMNSVDNFAKIAFVSFRTEEDKAAVLKANQVSEFQRFKLYFKKGKSEKYIKNDSGQDVLYWKDRHVYIEQAPEPNDVDWEFIHETTNNRLVARVKSNFQQFLLQLFCFTTIYIISYGQSLLIDKAMEAVVNKEQGADFHYMLVRLISVIISAIIVLLNKFWLGGQVHHIVDHEKWSTKTKLNISFAYKLTLALFCNTALITLAVEIVTFGNYYGVGGMITTESMVFIFNALVPPLAWLADPWHVFKSRRREAERKKGSKSVLTQEELNDLCEDTIYINGKRYADMMKTMWFTFFYCPIVPLGTIFSIFGLFIYYWIDKYNVVRRRTIKETISKDLTFQMIELLELIVIFHAFGDFMFKRALFGLYEQKDLIIVFAALLYNLSPLQAINEFIFPIDEEHETMNYEEAVHDFDNNYDRENPVHKKKALQDWIHGRNKKNQPDVSNQQLNTSYQQHNNTSFNQN